MPHTVPPPPSLTPPMKGIELTKVHATRIVLTPLNPRHGPIRLLVDTLREKPFRFGRNVECEQSYSHDYRISGLHAQLSWTDVSSSSADGGSLVITDSSVNGTFVNGKRVERGGSHEIADLDAFYLVIPDPGLLLQGYTGSLSTNFVGYTVRYAYEYGGGGGGSSIVLPSPLSECTPPTHVPPPPPLPPPPPPPAADGDADARCGDLLRQTASAPGWLYEHCDERRASAASESSGPRHSSVFSSGPAAPSAVDLEDHAVEHISFAAWWLAQRFGEHPV